MYLEIHLVRRFGEVNPAVDHRRFVGSVGRWTKYQGAWDGGMDIANRKGEGFLA